MDTATTVLAVVIIVFSAIIHEVMHGYVADRLGDPTARYAGRLTLNPVPHIDLFGSILFPLILALSSAPVLFGYAKPVPYNPYNLRPGRFSEAFVAGAGPLSNMVIALVAGVMIRSGFFSPMADILFLVVLLNTMLCFFNLIPVPPLDGSKVLEAMLPKPLGSSYGSWRHRMELHPFAGLAVVLMFVLLLGNLWGSFLYTIAHVIAGL